MNVQLWSPFKLVLVVLLFCQKSAAVETMQQFDIKLSAGGIETGYSEGAINYSQTSDDKKAYGIGFTLFYSSLEVESLVGNVIFENGFLGQSQVVDDTDNTDNDIFTDKRVLFAWFSPEEALELRDDIQLIKFEVNSIVGRDEYVGLNLIPMKTPSFHSTFAYSKLDGTEVPLTDLDQDSIPDEIDNCPTIPNQGQENTDMADDGGDACDSDDDNDNIIDVNDTYPLIAIGDLLDTDMDGAPNDCDEDCAELGMASDSDDDNDGVLDIDDAYPLDFSRSSGVTYIAKNDVDGDGTSDILWRSYSKGWNFLWGMNGVETKTVAPINVVPEDVWDMVGQGDYNGDGKSDILWRNNITGQNFIYLMDGKNIKSKATLNYVTAPIWEVKGSGDFNGDGKGDVLWRRVDRGDTWFYLMDNGVIGTSLPSLWVTDLNYKIAAIGDINGDGTDDVLWRHQVTGINYIWIMENGQIANRYTLNSISTDWTVAGMGDLDGDGADDIILRNQVDGRNWAYLMENGTVKVSQLINTVGDTNWQIVNMGDYDGDGKTDMLWRNVSAERNIVHLMDGLTIKAKGVLKPTDNTWALAK
ncbi:VCBS repeat-containing protein [Paraglaciecola sp. 25GB23A]|uniref:FG-GAP repeat domain-containing protein n=1 Tax=Paraglaciecola sp. 25GB23A TaxID=3156068 RepID=UPI0032AF0032